MATDQGYNSEINAAVYSAFKAQLAFELKDFGGSETGRELGSYLDRSAHKNFRGTAMDRTAAASHIGDQLQSEHGMSKSAAAIAARNMIAYVERTGEDFRRFASRMDAILENATKQEGGTIITAAAISTDVEHKLASGQFHLKADTASRLGHHLYFEGQKGFAEETLGLPGIVSIPPYLEPNMFRINSGITNQFKRFAGEAVEEARQQDLNAQVPDRLRWHVVGREVQHEMLGSGHRSLDVVDAIASAMMIGSDKDKLQSQLNANTTLSATDTQVILTIPTSTVGNRVSDIDRLIRTIGGSAAARLGEISATDTGDLQIKFEGDPESLGTFLLKTDINAPAILSRYADEAGVELPAELRQQQPYRGEREVESAGQPRATLKGAVPAGEAVPQHGQWR